MTTPAAAHMKATPKTESSSLLDALHDVATDLWAWVTYLCAGALTYAMVLPSCHQTTNDWGAHAALIDGWTDIAYPGWHVLASTLKTLLSLPTAEACALASALFAALATFGIRVMARLMAPRLDARAADVLSLCLTMVGPLYFPWIKSTYYVGTGTPNAWHNPTNAAARPFALLCLALYGWLSLTRSLTRKTTQEHGSSARPRVASWLALAALLLLSAWCKPSFFQVFFPAVGIYAFVILVNSRGRELPFAAASMASFAPVLALIAYQYLFYFGDGDSSMGGVAIDPLAVWRLYTPSVIYSVVCALAFPLYATICEGRRALKDPWLMVGLLCALFGALEYALLAETGEQRMAGNFGWGWLLGCTLYWCVATFAFARQSKSWAAMSGPRRIVRVVGWVLFAAHLALGTYCYVRMLTSIITTGDIGLFW